jgi:hypothetical protein
MVFSEAIHKSDLASAFYTQLLQSKYRPAKGIALIKAIFGKQ